LRLVALPPPAHIQEGRKSVGQDKPRATASANSEGTTARATASGRTSEPTTSIASPPRVTSWEGMARRSATWKPRLAKASRPQGMPWGLSAFWGLAAGGESTPRRRSGPVRTKHCCGGGTRIYLPRRHRAHRRRPVPRPRANLVDS
jgi:hypothetical protein